MAKRQQQKKGNRASRTPQKGAEEKSSNVGKIKSDFPKLSLREVIQLSEAIENKNGGQPMPPTDLAIAIDKSPGSSVFRALLSASYKYGLTAGTEKAERVEIRELGVRIVSPKSNDDKQAAIVNAVLTPATFRALYDSLKGKKLPENQFFQNTVIRDFGIPRLHAAACVSVFLENVEYAGLVREATTGRWLAADAKPQPLEEKIEAIAEEQDDTSEDYTSDRSGNGSQQAQGVRTGFAGQQDAQDPRAKRVYITHGKNRAFIDPLKDLLGFGELDPVVSVEKESVSMPVPEKVMADMRGCSAAIIHVDAELEMIDKEGDKHIILNPNVMMEIGAAMALYGRRFILLVRDGVKLPSNLQGLYEVRYQGDRLDGDVTIRLLKAIKDIKNHPLPAFAPPGPSAK